MFTKLLVCYIHCITSNSEWPWNFYTDKKKTMRILYFYFAFSIVIVDVRFVMIYSMLIFNVFSVISWDIRITTYSSILVCHLMYVRLAHCQPHIMMTYFINFF